MADFGQPVAQNTNPVGQGMQTLSGLLDINSKRLGIQQQTQALQGQAAQVQQEQQTAGQRAGIANFMQNFDPTKHVGADGTIDLDGVFSDPQLRSAAGDQFPQLMQQMLAVKNGQLQNKQALVNLNDSTRTQFQQMVGGLRTDPDVIQDNSQGRQKVNAAMGEFAATGSDASRIAQIYGPVTQHAPQGKLQQAISDMQLQAMDASTQASHQAPTLVDTGPNLQNVNSQAAPLTVGKGLSPTDQPGYKATVSNIGPDADRYNQISTENGKGQSMLALSQQVANLSDQVRTGKLSKEWTDRLAVLQQDSPSITARQMLTKYAAQLKTMAEAGASTDAERSTVEAGLPSPETQDPAAVKEAAQYVGGMGALRKARDAVASQYIQKNGTNGLRAVDDAFMQHADPFLYTYKSLPAGADRQKFLLKQFGDGSKITNQAGLQQFLDQQNVVKHYGG